MGFFSDFIQNAYFHCLHYIVNKRLHWLERVFWFFWIMLSMAGVIAVVNQSLYIFHTKKASVRVRTDYLEFVTPFPAVYFCEKREIEGKVDQMLKELNFALKTNNSITEITNFVRSATFIRPGTSRPKLSTCNDTETEFCRFTMTYSENLQIFVKYVRATCEEIFTSCTFNANKFHCCKYFLPVDTFEGNCYALNSLNAIVETRLRSHLKSTYSQKDLPFKLSHYRKLNPANLSVEVKHLELGVWFMGNTNVPTKMYEKDNQFDLTGLQESTDVYLRVQEVVYDKSILNLEEAQRDCRFWYENRTLKALKIYSNSACEIECLRKAQLMNCNCVVHLLPNQNGYNEPICNTTGIECNHADETDIMHYLSEDCKCINSCHVLDVFDIGKVSHESIRFRSQDSMKRVNFIVRAPTVQFVRYPAQGSLDFIVSIGGAITLFIGCSFLSLAQIFYYFLLKPFSQRCIVEKRK